MYDVIVAGGGPAGSIAAQKCVRKGFRTLLVERKRLPCDKVCSGMVKGSIFLDDSEGAGKRCRNMGWGESNTG